jgi:hypothetical protein
MRSWGAFDDCIRTGKTAAHLLDGIDDPFAAFDADPSARAQFDNAMAEGAHQVARQIADAYDFTDITRIVDVGGGYGTLLPPILHSRPGMTGIVVDRPNCREGAERTIAETGLHDRYSFVGADFFVDALPPGADAYVLKSVLHDFDVERSIAILRRCREAMTDSSRLLVVEIVVPDRLERTARHRGIVAADLHMLVATGGRERTESQYRALLAAAGLRLETVTPTGTAPGFDVIDARPT